MSIAIRLRVFIHVVLILIARLFVLSQAESQIYFTYHSPYYYLKWKDAGSLSSQWMNPGFDNSSWTAGNAPFRYGDGYSLVSSVNDPDGDPGDYLYWKSSAKMGGNPFSDNLLQIPEPPTANLIFQIVAYPNPTSAIIFVN